MVFTEGWWICRSLNNLVIWRFEDLKIEGSIIRQGFLILSYNWCNETLNTQHSTPNTQHKNMIAKRFCIYLLFLLVNVKAFSQFNFARQQLLVAFDKIKNIPVSVDADCAYVMTGSVEKDLEQVTRYDLAGNWHCSELILSKIAEQNQKLTAKEKVQLILARAAYFDSRQNFDSAKTLADIANEAAGKNEWFPEKIKALIILSSGSMKRRNTATAYQCADSALQISRKIHDRLLEGKALMQMALCARRHFTAFGKRAFPYYLQAIDLAQSTGDTSVLFAANMYCADDHFEILEWEEGINHLNNAVALVLKSNNIRERYVATIGVGYGLTQQGGLMKEALELYRKALAISKSTKLPYDIEISYSFISAELQHLKQYDSALAYVDLAGSVTGIDSLWANDWEKRARIYKDMGNYKMATEMYAKAIDWNSMDVLYRNQEQVSGYEAKLNTKEKELQVGLEKKRSGQLEWIVGGAVILLVFVAFALLNQRAARKKLSVQNIIIEKQRAALENSLSEKDMLLKEIHHRVKNNLSVIGSLLELQSSGMDDEKAKAAILEGQNRVRSIALIHQRLYQHENLSAIEFGGFVQDMIREVSGIFKKPGQKLNINLQIPETLLDIDTAVPLGLIMNELLTNSFKYAFEENEEAAINVNLAIISKGNYLLKYSDNGPGMPEGFDLKKSSTLGLRLIYRLSKQLGGTAEYSSDEGCMFVIRFKDAFTRNQEA